MLDTSQIASWPPEKIILALVLLALPIVPNLWSIWHAYFRQFDTDQEKLLWIAGAVFIPVLGGLAYLFVGRRRSRKYETPTSTDHNNDSSENNK